MAKRPASIQRPRIKRARKARRASASNMTRTEFNRVIDLLNEHGETLNQIGSTLAIQFQRIAQIQAELDVIKEAWAKIRAAAGR